MTKARLVSNAYSNEQYHSYWALPKICEKFEQFQKATVHKYRKITYLKLDCIFLEGEVEANKNYETQFGSDLCSSKKKA